MIYCKECGHWHGNSHCSHSKETATMHVTRRSPITGEMNTMEVHCTPQQYEAWLNGTLIQNAMPDATADQREFLKTGMTPTDWDKLFSKETDQ